MIATHPHKRFEYIFLGEFGKLNRAPCMLIFFAQPNYQSFPCLTNFFSDHTKAHFIAILNKDGRLIFFISGKREL
jgi:hypothetical protein